MATYDGLFDNLGFRPWCGQGADNAVQTMDDLAVLAHGQGGAGRTGAWGLPFPSLDELHRACDAIPRTRDLTAGVETAFLAAKDGLKLVLDPITQPLSWALDSALWLFAALPWFVLIPALLVVVWLVARSVRLTGFVAAVLLFLALIDHYQAAVQTLSIIFVCTCFCVLFGVPAGIAMARHDRLRRLAIPVLDMLQTLPSFVYLIPLIFLFSVTESKLYGIAIILYAIVPVIRLTDLGVRLVDPEILEAADAFGMKKRQRLVTIELPLALPNIMAGINQTIMMSLAMVVIASLVSAPGLGVLVLRGIRNLELGVGLVSGLGIVLLAIMLDRVTNAALARVSHGRGRKPGGRARGGKV